VAHGLRRTTLLTLHFSVAVRVFGAPARRDVAQRVQHRLELDPALGQGIADRRRNGRLIVARDQAVGFQSLQAVGQHLRGNVRQQASQFAKPQNAVRAQQPKDVGRPRSGDLAEHEIDGASVAIMIRHASLMPFRIVSI